MDFPDQRKIVLRRGGPVRGSDPKRPVTIPDLVEAGAGVIIEPRHRALENTVAENTIRIR
jgi:hypothetical protein